MIQLICWNCFSSRLADEHHIIIHLKMKILTQNKLLDKYLFCHFTIKIFFLKRLFEPAIQSGSILHKFPVQYLGLQVNNYDTSNHSVQYSGNIFLTWHIRVLLIIIQITFRYKISLRTLNNFRRMTLRSSLVMTGRYTDLMESRILNLRFNNSSRPPKN